MKLLDGKWVSSLILEEITEEVTQLKNKFGKTPHLAAILVGNDGASETYVGSKMRNCEKVGMRSSLVRLESAISEKELLDAVEKLNQDENVDGFIVQLPLPKHISEANIIKAISPSKDVDGFHPDNIGKMVLNMPSFIPATPFGILQMIEKYRIETAGKHCVVVGRSHIVGLPMSILMARNAYPGNCTVTLTHSRTANLKEVCQSADILIVAMGKPDFITADMVKEGAVVIDVGTTRVPDSSKKSGYAIKGDVNFAEVSPKCAYISPVPGGVGLMTVTSLIMNTLLAAKNSIG
ncbi:MAG: bifunctional 5,10-methylene-tetrahydrofolate dehydrogenase/5,10-methylene-tetrahydrofolate cyclohydrolase [Cytophagales bacterium]|nr:MAG: bifunctional 5,10-methylene-tetrahydrofolate dehydrogenase/5,10-methylene-tetrahydrofolate cyclohydrolase [Cytophagales bacterium]